MGCTEPKSNSKVYKNPKDPNTGLETSVPENTSCIIKFILYDSEVKEPIPNSAINTATMSLINDVDESIIQIGGSDSIDVKPFVDGVGQFRYVLEGQYNILLDDDDFIEFEIHWAKFEFNFTAGSDIHNLLFNYKIDVENNKLVDQP